MPKDIIVAAVLAGIVAAESWLREPQPADVNDRLAAVGFAWLLVAAWRPLAKMPNYGFIERFASKRGSEHMGSVLAIICWVVFLLMVGAVAFQE